MTVSFDGSVLSASEEANVYFGSLYQNLGYVNSVSVSDGTADSNTQTESIIESEMTGTLTRQLQINSRFMSQARNRFMADLGGGSGPSLNDADFASAILLRHLRTAQSRRSSTVICCIAPSSKLPFVHYAAFGCKGLQLYACGGSKQSL
ncbi:hypothetical protein C0081_20435 [Cohaesibacter celericrescens]|uniref:Uncharacterized protein n=1 Tax=Cohaesibacter celericrescens TaxID=2067669 RepID=A0A2N5XL09_9HYPH|nr:hypothetical protein C0081_20435 [Cohaesibacter celericrescens]